MKECMVSTDLLVDAAADAYMEIISQTGLSRSDARMLGGVSGYAFRTFFNCLTVRMQERDPAFVPNELIEACTNAMKKRYDPGDLT